jgi:xanthine dehydrogenase accessory factor
VARRDGRIFGEVDASVEGAIVASATSALSSGSTMRRSVEIADIDSGQVEIFVDVIQPAPTLVIIGGVHIAVALVSIAKTLGFRTIVVDPRRAFGTRDRFENVDKLIQSWPDEAFKEIDITSSTAVIGLTHDPKIDDPALIRALSSQAFYVGALGSRITHEGRRIRLIEAGLTEERVKRIKAPIGIDINAQSPEEIAVSIMAQVIAERRAG